MGSVVYRALVTISVFALSVPAFLVAGCGSGAPAARVPDARGAVVSTAYPLADVARQVGGEETDVTWWIESGGVLDGFTPDDEQARQLRSAPLVLSGGNCEPAVVRLFEDGFNQRRLLRLDVVATEDDAGLLDPWMDDRLVARFAGVVADRLAEQVPARAETYRRNAREFADRVRQIGDTGRSDLFSLKGKRVGTIGRSYAALARATGLTPISLAVVPPFKLDDRALAQLSRDVETTGVCMVFVEADTPAGVLRELRQRLQVPVVVIDSLGSSSTAGRDTYLKLLQFNLDQLRGALAGQSAVNRLK